MERRILIAFALSFLVFVMWVRLFPPPTPEQGPEAVENGEVSVPSDGDVQNEGSVVGKSESAPAESVSSSPVDEERTDSEASLDEVTSETAQTDWPRREGSIAKDIVVETPHFIATISSRGARLTSLVLQDYRDSEDAPYEMVARAPSAAIDRFPLDVSLASEEETAKLSNAIYEESRSGVRLRPGNDVEIVFTWADGLGLEVDRRFRFDGDSFRIGMELSVRRRGREIAKTVWAGPGVGEETSTSRYVGVDKAVFVRGGQPQLFDGSDLEEAPRDAGGAIGVGVASHYFAALVLPTETRPETTEFITTSWSAGEDSKTRDLISAGVGFGEEPARFEFFVGPKQLEILSSLGPGMSEIIEFGDWLKVVAVPLRQALMWAYGFVGNYGWAIVVLTILINVAFAPLKHYSYVSMRKMQKLAPQTKKIQERYKKLKPTDPKRQEMNQEMMALYKKHNVSPLSGCLPMLLTIPFFFAFYRLLMASIELRQAPFFGWIQDLSVHDPIFVLPILMGITQVGMQKLTPTASADPTQAKIMGMMPLFITFLLAWAPAGLVLYWFTNNLVSMAQQLTTNKLLSSKDAEPVGEETSKKRRKRTKSVEQTG